MSASATEEARAGLDDRTFGWAAIGLAVLHAVGGLLLFEPTLFPGGDNAGYLILGESLRGGEGYRDLYLPGAPLHAKYPPVLPSMLAVLGWIGSVQVFKLAMLACTSVTVWLTARVGKSLVGAGPALVAAGLLAINPTLLEYGHYILSEAPFVMFVMLSMWAAGRDDRLGTALAIGAAVAAFGTRTAGLAMLFALPIAWLFRRQFARAAIAGGAAITTMAAWAIYQGRAAPTQASYLQELMLVDPYTPEAGAVGFAGLIARAAGNLWAYASTVIPQALLGTSGPPSGVVTALGILVALLALLGWARRAKRGLGAPELFILLYGGLIAIWPAVWTDRRFLLPAVPLLLLYAVSCLTNLPEGMPGAVRRFALPVLAGLVAIPGVVWTLERAPGRMECVASYRAGSPCDAPALASLYEAGEWARENTEPEAIIVNRKPRLFWWYSRRQGDLYPYSADPETVMRAIDAMGATYVLVDQVSGTTGRYLVPAIQATPGRFEPVYEGGSPPTLILRLRPAGGNAE